MCESQVSTSPRAIRVPVLADQPLVRCTMPGNASALSCADSAHANQRCVLCAVPANVSALMYANASEDGFHDNSSNATLPACPSSNSAGRRLLMA